MSAPNVRITVEVDRNKDSKKEKTPALETFPADETPTPTKILRMADMDLFQDLKENPFDAHFRKATEAVKQGADSLSASLSATEISDDTLNTPQIYCSDANTPQITPSAPRPVILRAHPHNRGTGSGVPVASVQPVKTYKPIAPNPVSLPAVASPDNAMLLLKFPGGETIKLSNLPFVKADIPPTPSTVNQETRLKLKRVLSTPKGPSVQIQSPTQSLPLAPSVSKNNEQYTEEGEKNELKERNRMSAQRSRQKKRQHFESLAETCNNMQKENSALNTENKVLREEIVSLKRLLGQHLDCSVTQLTGQRDTLQNAIEPKMVSLVATQKSKLKTYETPRSNIQSPKSKQNEENIMNIQVEVSNEVISMQTSSVENTADIVEDTPSKYEKQSRNENYTNKSVPIVPSPPQTFPEDLRVDTRLKETEESQFPKTGATLITSQERDRINTLRLMPTPQKLQPTTPNPGFPSPVFVRLTPTSECVKQTLALHCHRVGSEREEKNASKGVVAKRLKDKLQILKQKMAEDANMFPSTSSEPNNP
eukprot:GFUD01022725.1.p1 GENE.GFUD01022725.1~~GFUD01022725.1.p1  ORF type:complete len:553 (+),score=148.72 GFUD01022725.1:49-1659(+)